jgi:hypothetical protein
MAVQHSYGKMVTDGLVLYLNAADANSYVSGSTTWYDLAGSNNGTLLNGVAYTGSNFGSLVFDGSDDIINTNVFSGRNPATDPFTVEAMVKSNTTSGTRMWVDVGSNGINQRFYSALIDGTTSATGIQSTGWADATPNHTNWSHQVIVMDGQNAKAYADSIFKYQIGYTSYTLPGGLNIGGRSGFLWLGQISIFKVYNRALSTTEILQNYNATKTRFGLT